jgi:hypothetical protein
MAKRLTLRDQLLGAAAGTLVALGIYAGYKVAAPAVLALLPEAPTVEAGASKFTDADRAERRQEIAARTRKLISAMQAQAESYQE